MAAEAIATALHQSLSVVDLNQVQPDDFTAVLASLEAHRYPILLIKSTHVWFGRHSTLAVPQLAQWLQQRHSEPGLTLLSTRYLHTIKARWRQQMDGIFTLPLPHRATRKLLWQQAFAHIVVIQAWIGRRWLSSSRCRVGKFRPLLKMRSP